MKEFDSTVLEKQITERLINEHKIDELLVDSFLSQAQVKGKIYQNIVWSVLMGADYWANEIAEILKLYLEEKKENNKRNILVNKARLFSTIR